MPKPWNIYIYHPPFGHSKWSQIWNLCSCILPALYYRGAQIAPRSRYSIEKMGSKAPAPTLYRFFWGVVSCSPRIYIFKISPFLFFDRPSSKSWPHTGQAVRCPCKKKMGEQQRTSKFTGGCLFHMVHMMPLDDSTRFWWAFCVSIPRKKILSPCFPKVLLSLLVQGLKRGTMQ